MKLTHSAQITDVHVRAFIELAQAYPLYLRTHTGTHDRASICMMIMMCEPGDTSSDSTLHTSFVHRSSHARRRRFVWLPSSRRVRRRSRCCQRKSRSRGLRLFRGLRFLWHRRASSRRILLRLRKCCVLLRFLALEPLGMLLGHRLPRFFDVVRSLRPSLLQLGHDKLGRPLILRHGLHHLQTRTVSTGTRGQGSAAKLGLCAAAVPPRDSTDSSRCKRNTPSAPCWAGRRPPPSSCPCLTTLQFPKKRIQKGQARVGEWGG